VTIHQKRGTPLANDGEKPLGVIVTPVVRKGARGRKGQSKQKRLDSGRGECLLSVLHPENERAKRVKHRQSEEKKGRGLRRARLKEKQRARRVAGRKSLTSREEAPCNHKAAVVGGTPTVVRQRRPRLFRRHQGNTFMGVACGKRKNTTGEE